MSYRNICIYTHILYTHMLQLVYTHALAFHNTWSPSKYHDLEPALQTEGLWQSRAFSFSQKALWENSAFVGNGSHHLHPSWVVDRWLPGQMGQKPICHCYYNEPLWPNWWHFLKAQNPLMRLLAANIYIYIGPLSFSQKISQGAPLRSCCSLPPSGLFRWSTRSLWSRRKQCKQFLQFWLGPCKFWQLDSFHPGTMLVTHSCLPGEQRAKAKVWIALRFSQKLEETGKCTKTHSTSVDGLAQTTFAIGAMPARRTAGIAPVQQFGGPREKQPWIILQIP